MSERNLHILKLSKLSKVATNLIDGDVTGKVPSEQLVVWICILALLVPHRLHKWQRVSKQLARHRALMIGSDDERI
jgi:hypothetical protein